MSTPYPPVRSFRPRRRALSPTRTVMYDRLLAQWGLAVDGALIDLDELFRTASPTNPDGSRDVVLDIGFGGGEGLIDMAAARADEMLIGVDIHTPGVAKVLETIEANGWRHVRVVDGDVLELLPRIPYATLAGIRMYFPDPWPKQKQKHRRLTRPDVVAALVDRLRVGGTFHLATDSADYAAHAVAVLTAEQRLRGGAVPRPDWRPLTRFERRGLDAGRTPTDLIYERIC